MLDVLRLELFCVRCGQSLYAESIENVGSKPFQVRLKVMPCRGCIDRLPLQIETLRNELNKLLGEMEEEEKE